MPLTTQKAGFCPAFLHGCLCQLARPLIFGVVNGGAPGGTSWHQNGETRLEVRERLIVMFSFYGPGANGNAKALRNGLFIEQNRAMLRRLANMAMRLIMRAQ